MAGFARFTMVKFAVVSCVGNSGNMKGKFTYLYDFETVVYQWFI